MNLSDIPDKQALSKLPPVEDYQAKKKDIPNLLLLIRLFLTSAFYEYFEKHYLQRNLRRGMNFPF